MKTIAAASLIAAQLLAAAPVRAADLGVTADQAQVRMGAFAGARVRLAFGGPDEGRVHAGLALAPFSRSQTIDGRASLRYGEGFEFGIAGRGPAGFRLAGYRLGPGPVRGDAGGPRLGLSTLGTAAVVGGVIVVGLLGLAFFGRGNGCCA
ncbi:MAG: hypothetical protein QOD42_3627 [Sphingomonadales bacterium]|jgi:hypothetical protein|nr:hypothetical protein [Sphingomonadales bacterium]